MSFDRNELIRSMLDPSGRGLEIGPSHAPVFPRAGGYDIEILDYAPASELRRRFASLGVDVEAIEEVDHVSDGRSIHDVIGKEHCFDYIFSSHVIEHVPDFVAYFQSCERLLKDGGTAVLAIPDKRYIFDAYHFPTTTGEILEAHARGGNRHRPARVFDFVANYAQMGPAQTWDDKQTGYLKLSRPIQEAWDLLKSSYSEEDYVDIHAWRLTPASMRLIMFDINALGLCNMRINHLISHGTFEFYVSLTTTGPGDHRPREELVRALHAEQVMASLHILGDGHGLPIRRDPPPALRPAA